MFIHEFSYWRTPRLPQHQENKPLEPPARLRWFNEFYLLDKSVNIVMGENKRSSSPHFNPVRAQRRLSPWRTQPPRATVGTRPSQGEGRGIRQHGWPHSLNFHSCRHMGQCCCTCCAFSHLRMQCMWKQCEHWPHTSGQSSPGTLPVGGTRGPVSHPEHRTSAMGEACPGWPQGSEKTGIRKETTDSAEQLPLHEPLQRPPGLLPPPCGSSSRGAQQQEELWPGPNPHPLASRGLGPSADTLQLCHLAPVMPTRLHQCVKAPAQVTCLWEANHSS